MRSTLLAIVVCVIASACSSGTVTVVATPDESTTTAALPETPDTLVDIEIMTLASGLSDPVAFAAAPGIERTFVVERIGRITTLDRPSSPVLDITDQVGWDVNEQGLLGAAVHPSFPEDPRAFVVYTNLDRDVVITSFDWNGAVFDASSEREVLLVPQPHFYHQGGGIAFGPRGLLWVSLGDGGGGGDKRQNGQDPTTLRGTFVRIDIDAATPYGIPDSNPFPSGEEGAPEVWAFGLRNPWRFAFDGAQLVVADVGETTSDEINVVPVDAPGLNYGWPIMEGVSCFRDDPCDEEGLVVPVHVVPRKRSCAVIGGPVYRGSRIPEMFGHFIYGDFCVGWVRSAPLLDGALGPEINWETMFGTVGMITSFGLDHEGELLIATIEGNILGLQPVRQS